MRNTKDKFFELTAVYSDQAILRTAINAIPYIGGPMDVLLSTTGQKYVAKRIEKFISELSAQVELLGKDKIDVGYLETEPGYDMLSKAFNAVAKTRQEEKIKLYACIISGAVIINKKINVNEPELYLSIVDELAVDELAVAKILFDVKKDLKTPAAVRGSDIHLIRSVNPSYTKEELVSILLRLEKSGLVKEYIFTQHGSGGGTYEITERFRNFMNFMSHVE